MPRLYATAKFVLPSPTARPCYLDGAHYLKITCTAEARLRLSTMELIERARRSLTIPCAMP